jgi:cell shape-determining protein MreC
MKIAIYQNGTLATVLEGVNNPKLVGSELTFDQGSITGTDENHILLDDAAEAPETLEEAKTLNQMDRLSKVQTLEEENAELRSRLESAEMAIITLMDFL